MNFVWKTVILLTYFLINLILFSQSVNNSFIDALINNKENIIDYVDKDELTRSNRLGIQYEDVKNKWLISYDIPDKIKEGFREGKYNYSLQQMQLEDGFSVVTLAVPSINYIQKFYFLNDKFVPPSRYITRNWQQKTSKYFLFRISEPKYFNDYCIKKLDDFVDKTADTLDFTREDKELLMKEKIYYFFCKSEDEVEQITNYKSKGMAIIAYDEIITAYQTHFHEAAHLLINFRLRTPGLYTLPFFMEGFAVAMGGRGGMAPAVVTDLGYYLQKTRFLPFDTILTNDAFYHEDANMTYAVSGLYNSFLLQELGGEGYIRLYKNGNGSLEYVKNLRSGDLNLPPKEKFINFTDDYYAKRSIVFLNYPEIVLPDLQEKKLKNINGYYLMEWRDVTNIFVKEFNYENYISRQFQKLFPEQKFNSQMYTIISEKNKTIRVYNLLNDELIASFDVNFLLENKIYESKYYFLKTGLFENNIAENAYWQQSPQ